MKSNKKTKRTTPAPVTVPEKTRARRVFELIDIVSMPSRAKSKDWTDVDAALEAALADPDKAVVFFSGEPAKATYERGLIHRRLEQLSRENEFNVSARLGKVYIWKA